jgi:cytochrome c-type biogenesis protein CcmE
MKPKHQRALWLMAGLLSVALGVGVLLTNFRDNIVFFFSPTEALARQPSPERLMRVGGLVVKGSMVKKGDDIRFVITDTKTNLAIHYQGLPPNLFREGIGVVAEGHLVGATFEATRLLAKHDEKYMPPEVAKAIKDAGHWKTQYPHPAAGGMVP